ncbi:MAG: antibiotic biosynthesis monooxygenase family protein [Bacteroidota bacterium]
MFVRIVKMIFKEESIEEFKALFEERKEKIRHFEGCQHLELWQDRNDPTVFFTYSFWAHPDHLEAYRHSELFQDTWAKTKALFGGKPQAWSVDQLHNVNPK